MKRHYLVFFILLIPVFVLASKQPAAMQQASYKVPVSGPAELSVPVSVLLGRPTASSITANILMGDIGGSQAEVYIEYGMESGVYPLQTGFIALGPNQTGEVVLAGLESDTPYNYRVRAQPDGGTGFEASGEYSFMTQRQYNANFVFAVVADPHVMTSGTQINILKNITRNIAGTGPDFVVSLGDNIMSSPFGNSAPIPNETFGRLIYSNLREGASEISYTVPFYLVIGNWEGENGWFSQGDLDFGRYLRRQYFPNPDHTTYAQGGSPYGDYYAWTWGDGLFIVLNVMTYTTTDHTLFRGSGTETDWTLGAEQLDWFNSTLISNSGKKWKFVFIHHAVGGYGIFPEGAASAYGRGGGRAAHVGEQETVHQLMRQYNVDVFFYGHDHCFVDMVVDGIHYTSPGRAGSMDEFCYQSGHGLDGIDGQGHSTVFVTRNSIAVDFFDIQNNRIGGYVIDKTPPGGPSGSPLIMKQQLPLMGRG